MINALSSARARTKVKRKRRNFHEKTFINCIPSVLFPTSGCPKGNQLCVAAPTSLQALPFRGGASKEEGASDTEL